MLKAIKKRDSSWPFWEPVDVEDTPDYLSVVSTPMCLDQVLPPRIDRFSSSEERHFSCKRSA